MQKFLTLAVLASTLAITGLAHAGTQSERAHQVRQNFAAAQRQVTVYRLIGKTSGAKSSVQRKPYARLIRGGRAGH